MCIFEHIYFARPDQTWDGINVHHVRQRLGEELAREVINGLINGLSHGITDENGVVSGLSHGITDKNGVVSGLSHGITDENGVVSGLSHGITDKNGHDKRTLSRNNGQKRTSDENGRFADVVIPVPDSSVPAAIGFSHVAGIPYNDGFIKNRYVGRTFIEPTDSLRKRGVALKFNVINDNVRGKRVVMIDDSIVRGNTTGPLIKLLKNAGAKEVHVAITCPPIAHPCFMGVDMGKYEDLIAHKRTVDEIREFVGADSLYYLSVDGMMRAIQRTDGFCQACFTGKYPIPVDLLSVKTGFERATK
ncbi:MAG: hypothetical protein IT311_10035 [Anaerolineales bacterium]|nr:hypothetical protein [Anaerolineales bacterium]